MKKYKIIVYAEVIVEAEDKEEAIFNFFEEVENTPQQTCASWIEDHLKVEEIKE